MNKLICQILFSFLIIFVVLTLNLSKSDQVYAAVSFPHNRVFITDIWINGNVDGGFYTTPGKEGIKGADALCQSQASSASLGGTWKAWLSDSTSSPATSFIHSSVPYTLVDNTTIVANSWADLTKGSLQHSIDKDEKGNLVDLKGGIVVWTNTNTDGTANSTSNNCNDWTSVSGGSSETGNTGLNWTTSGTDVCNQNVYHALYCFEQVNASTPTPTTTAAPYVTSYQVSENGPVFNGSVYPISGGSATQQYTFVDQTPGLKTLWVRFKYSNGSTSAPTSSQVLLVKPSSVLPPYITSYQVSENGPVFNGSVYPISGGSATQQYTFVDQTPGLKTLWVRFKYSDGSTSVPTSTQVLLFKPFSGVANPFGVTSPWNVITTQDLDSVNGSWWLNWSPDICQSSGYYKDSTDSCNARITAHQNGTHPFVPLFSSTIGAWKSYGFVSDKDANDVCSPTTPGNCTYNTSAMYNFIQSHILDRLGTSGNYYVIGNEPNEGDNPSDSDGYESHPDFFANEFYLLATQIKRADPAAKIVGPGIIGFNQTSYGEDTGIWETGYQWWEKFVTAYEGLSAKYPLENPQHLYPPIDVFNTHLYDLQVDYSKGSRHKHADSSGHTVMGADPTTEIQELNLFRTVMNSEDNGAPIWVTEFGIIPCPLYSGLDCAQPNVPGSDQSNNAQYFLSTLIPYFKTNQSLLNLQRWFIYTGYDPRTAGTSFPDDQTNPNWKQDDNGKIVVGIQLFTDPGNSSSLTDWGKLYKQE